VTAGLGSEPAIAVSGLVKDFGRARALDGLTLSVDKGEIVGFLGPNGAGKTTTLRILFDLLRPTTGKASVLGHDCQADSVRARRMMGYLPGDLRLYEGLTGQETIDYFSRLRGQAVDAEFLHSLVERLALDTTRRVSAYSKGNRQKLGLVLALMHQPPVLVLDEPTSGLDPLVQEAVAQLLFEMAGRGHTVFFSSHVLSEAERMCHRVAFLRQGRLIAFEDVAAIKGRSLHIIEVTFAQPVPPDAFQVPGVREVERDGNMVHLEVREHLDEALKAIARHPVIDLRTEQPSLEEVFLAFYEGRQEAAQ
jgi:ABC-2 type transport system ATP-binding protein